METKEDVQLIHDILSGNDDAFSTLVQKYERSVHALAWRKIRDFHYAEEITQDTFLQAYKKLPTLKNPHQFAGWLYVIANRLCLNWLQRNKSAMQSLEGTSVRKIDVEYQRGLFKWKLGDPAWINTGLVDTSQVSYRNFRGGFKIAVSDETVYVGQRNGHLFQSLDEGNSWKDITSSLPLRFTRFKEVTFVGSTIYVATDNGTLVSQTGEHWSVLTDAVDRRPIVDRFATDGTKVYGVGEVGVYRLDASGQWEQISSNAPDNILSLVASNNRLYSVTQQRGMFHIPLETDSVGKRSDGY